MNRSEIKTKGGYALDEVVSALQKSIRRGEEEAAMFWSLELVDSGYGKYLWKRLMIIAAEDIGIAEPSVLSFVVNGWLATKETTESFSKPRGMKTEFIGPVILVMCRAQKCREGDDFAWYIGERRERGWKLEIPDFAVDYHTDRGRKMGRGEAFWFSDASRLVNAIPENTYGTKVKKLLSEGKPVQGAAGKIEETAPGVFQVESFTTPGTFYWVDLRVGTCTCPAFTKARKGCKHLEMIERRGREAR